jgi:hypothetical protein
MNYYTCSDGVRLTQAQINSRLSKERKGWREKYVCECFGAPHIAHDADHSISQKRCKEIGKTELIWDEGNISWSCREAHQLWESYKNGKFQYHKNFKKRMLFVAMYDYEGFMKRFHCLTEAKAIQYCEGLINQPIPF